MPKNNNDQSQPQQDDQVVQSEKKYKDTSTQQAFTDPFSKKSFWVVSGSESNIKRKDVFPISKDPTTGEVYYGTYTPPNSGGGIPITDYKNTTYREYEDKSSPTKIYFPGNNKEMESLYWGKNPYADRQQLSNPQLLESYTGDVKQVNRLSKVVPVFNANSQEKTENGVVMTKPGWHFYKEYENGERVEIPELEYQKLQGFNKAPIGTKEKIIAQDQQ